MSFSPPVQRVDQVSSSSLQVISHLRDAFFLTLDDVQLWVVDGLDGALDQLERLADAARLVVRQLQDTQVGRAATSGLDDVLSRLEEATTYYLPLPPTLREFRQSTHHLLKDMFIK